MTLIVSIGAEIDVVAQTDPDQAPSRYRCVLGGLQASPALVAHDGNQEGVAVELTRVGCRALLGGAYAVAVEHLARAPRDHQAARA